MFFRRIGDCGTAGRVGGYIGSGGSASVNVGVCSAVSLDTCVTSDPMNGDGVGVGGAVY